MAFHVGYYLAPEIKWEVVGCNTEYCDKMVFISFNVLLGYVSTMFIWGYQLVSHVGLRYDNFVGY